MKMMSMKIEKKTGEKGEVAPGMDMDREQYPYGLRLHLGDEELKKLGIKELPKVGAKIQLMAMVEVTGVNSDKTQEGERRNVSLQITDCGMDMGDKGMDMEGKASRMYGAGDGKGGM